MTGRDHSGCAALIAASAPARPQSTSGDWAFLGGSIFLPSASGSAGAVVVVVVSMMGAMVARACGGARVAVGAARGAGGRRPRARAGARRDGVARHADVCGERRRARGRLVCVLCFGVECATRRGCLAPPFAAAGQRRLVVRSAALLDKFDAAHALTCSHCRRSSQNNRF